LLDNGQPEPGDTARPDVFRGSPDMSADRDRGIRRQKQKRAKALKRAQRRERQSAPAKPAPRPAG